ncbi:hypothetical protein BKA82DRAFT_993620 [Pisolithus tinctorius]|uniref:Uncharacterized protein n=1 Tax=Pisolithus tinctorius Marx 270 TaxID=870435 RepID=A0A0C3PUY7_PISTI|nr:hypothetical protein BKA82DRAFT_993620 [Pisolithus tinctorius]KIO12639.1 hypothetical protein M404DRAFT_993620 [Pisolithus tinctorius Marx 270]
MATEFAQHQTAWLSRGADTCYRFVFQRNLQSSVVALFGIAVAALESRVLWLLRRSRGCASYLLGNILK